MGKQIIEVGNNIKYMVQLIRWTIYNTWSWPKLKLLRVLKSSVSLSVEFQLLGADNYLGTNITVQVYLTLFTCTLEGGIQLSPTISTTHIGTDNYLGSNVSCYCHWQRSQMRLSVPIFSGNCWWKLNAPLRVHVNDLK